VLGLAEPVRLGHFVQVTTANGVALDFDDADGDIRAQHYAFLVSDEEFDQIFGRIKERELPYWADPGRSRPGEIRQRNGARGVYFPDPSGHFLEILTAE
jgi:catechol 2,3-dioxygenase-like lactoylglutathione lyase family enzyme